MSCSPKLDGLFHLPCTLFVTDRAPKGSTVNGHFNKLKQLSYTLVGGHVIYRPTMACNSNAAAAIGNWLSSTNSPHQTKNIMCSHGEGITSDDFSQETPRCLNSIAGCAFH